MQNKVLLVQLASNGDCLLVTTIAKQIKEIDFPGCHLTWLIGSLYSQVIAENIFVDEIIEWPMKSRDDVIVGRNSIWQYIRQNDLGEVYNNIFITDFTPENYKNWYGSTRSSLFRSYPFKLKVEPNPIIYLTETEKINVRKFCVEQNLNTNYVNILFECSPQSSQSLMTFNTALSISNDLTLNSPNLKIILSSNQSFYSENKNIIDGSKLSWRENAELVNYCHFLVGCSSGISWLCTSKGLKSIPFVQVINPDYMEGRITASMKLDYMYFGMSTKNIIELYNPTYIRLKECLSSLVRDPFEITKSKFDRMDFRVFSNLKFLIEAKVGFSLKIWLFFKYALRKEFLNSYRKLKPKWFTPKLWLRGIK